MRRLLVFILFLLASFSPATPVLVIIAPDRAGPGAFIESTTYGCWIQWAPASRPEGTNVLMSLLSGNDWQGDGSETSFEYERGVLISRGYPALKASGYLAAKASEAPQPIYALEDAKHEVPAIAALLATTNRDPQIRRVTMSGPWPENGLVVAEATSWDMVAAIGQKAGGRVLVVEYPPQAGITWSKFYLRGFGWQKMLPRTPTTGVTGLFPAREIGALLLHPERFEWQPDDSGNWGGANRWLRFVQANSILVVTVLSLLLAYFIGASVYLLSREEKANGGIFAVKFLSLVPAAILVSGEMAWLLGTAGFWVWLSISLVGLNLLAALVNFVAKGLSHQARPLYGHALVGTIACALSPPLWSLYSHVLGYSRQQNSPEALAAFFTYLACAIVLGRGFFVGAWISRILVVGITAWGAILHPWWTDPSWTLLLIPTLFLLVGEGLFQVWMLVPTILLPLADGNVLAHGFTWAPGNLYRHWGDEEALNWARHAEFFLSPGFLGSALLAGVFALFLETYFVHQVKRVMRRDFRIRRILLCSAILAALGVFQPLLLYGALMLFIGGAIVLLTDPAWSL